MVWTEMITNGNKICRIIAPYNVVLNCILHCKVLNITSYLKNSQQTNDKMIPLP